MQILRIYLEHIIQNGFCILPFLFKQKRGRKKMQELMRTELGHVKTLWDDQILPRGITLKITKSREPDAQELIEEIKNE